MAGPSVPARLVSGLSRTTACGFPIETRSVRIRSTPTTNSWLPSMRARPMSTVTESTPLAPRCTVQPLGPESVSMTNAPSSPRDSARWRATQRIPLPHMAATEPSGL